VKPVLELLKHVRIKAMAHITGEGFYGNIPRVIPQDMNVELDRSTWQMSAIFALIRERSRLSLKEMFTTFNMGIGLVIILDTRDVERAQDVLRRFKLSSYSIGRVTKGRNKVIIR
jgi:phosphoribosylformylglycinamidine cyclo-ligase